MPTEPTAPPPDEPPGAPEPGDDGVARIPERPLPRGCHPLVFGVIMATIQLALTLYFMRSC